MKVAPSGSKGAAAAALLGAAFLIGCFDQRGEQVAGGGIETGNTGSLTGRVLTDAGRPVADANLILMEVKLTPGGPVSLSERLAASDDSGRYRFDSLPEGRYTVYTPGDGRLSAMLTRIHKPKGDLGLPDMNARGTVTLMGRVIPVPGSNVLEASVCVPGLGLCAHPGADSVYSISPCPLGSYEAVVLSGRSVQYVALDVRPSNAGAAGGSDTAYIRDIALGETAEDGRLPYTFYPADLDHSFTGLPVAYPDNAQPAWYRSKAFDSVRYFILNDGDMPKEALPRDYLAQWRYSSALQGAFVADAPDLSAPLAGFPVPIRLAAPRFDFSKAAADGSDLAVSDGQGRLLPIEIESWDAAAGNAVIWVRLDSLAAKRGDRNLVLHWGRAQPLPLSQGSGVFRADNGFVGVWHLGERGAGFKAMDARGVFTGFLMAIGDADPALVRSGAGAVGGGYALDTTSGYVNVRQQPSLDVSKAFTLSLWARALQAAPGKEQVLVSKWEPGAREWHFSVLPDGNLELEFGDPMGQIQGNVNGTVPVASLDQWHHYAATYDRGTIHLYLDGKEVPIRNAEGTIPKLVHLFEADIHIGSDQDPGISWKGSIDEFEYLSEAKSAEWIASVYATQKPAP
ncbi:MAG: flagellar motor protein MotA [Fibrobacteres bacterium]|nr:flagellar motor protein MotA [Fibrobacterota bacterium]